MPTTPRNPPREVCVGGGEASITHKKDYISQQVARYSKLSTALPKGPLGSRGLSVVLPEGPHRPPMPS